MNLLEKVQEKWQEIDVSNCNELFRDTLKQVIYKTAENIKRFDNQFPYYGDGNKYILTDNSTWVSGYWTAWLWQIYHQTKDPQFKEAAEKHFQGYNWRFNNPNIHCHDVGVIYDMAAVRAYTVTGGQKWKNVAIRGNICRPGALPTVRYPAKTEPSSTAYAAFPFGFGHLKYYRIPTSRKLPVCRRTPF